MKRKRWIVLLLIFVLAFVFVGCKNNNDNNKTTPTGVDISGQAIVNSKITLEINQETTITASVRPKEASQDIVWGSSKPEVATVDKNGKIVAVGIGETEIFAKAKAKQSTYASVTVIVQAPPADPESVTITGPDTVIKDSFITLKAVVEPSNASQAVIWETSDDTIATVENGRVEGIEIGKVTITVKVVADETITLTKEIEVVAYTTGPTAVKISGENEMIVGRRIVLTAAVLPSGSSQNVTWESLQPTIATISADGEVTALKEGTVWIVVKSVESSAVQDMHQIVVKPKPTPIPYPDLQEYEIKIMAAPHALNEHDPFDIKYKSDDKTAKQKAWRDIEDLMNCTLKVVPYPDTAPWGQPRIDWLNEKASTNTAETDIFVSTTEWLAQLVNGGSALNVLTYYQKYGQNSMSAGLKGASTYKGGLYSLIYPPVSGLTVDKGLFYNVNLVQELGLDSPASKFNEGNWSFDDFKAYVKEANGKLVEEQTVLSGRPVLYYMGMVNSSGVALANITNCTVNFNHPIAKEAATVLKELYDDVGWGDIAWDATVTSFNDNNSIFQSGDYWFVKTDNRWHDKLWGEGTTKFGYVPYPYANSKTKEDSRTSGIGGACYMQAAGREYPAYVNSEYVYRAFTEMMLKTADYILEDPTYDVIQKMRTAASNKLDDPESVEAIIFFTREKVLFDPMYELGGGSVRFTLSTAIEDVVVRGEDYATKMSEIETGILQSLLDVYS
ncbi:MAG: Ig-like domain-containing protein [Bacilli bacterium]|nr:Ig-like domain-containing protein [Bacilli bacterium]